MTARKRKSPDRKKNAKREPGLLRSLAAGSARAAARHPKPLFGCAAFGVIFSFVAANALWYQPGGHPSPFLATRDAQDPNRIAGYRPMRRTAPDDVTTFRIERASPASSPSHVPVETQVSAPAPVEVPQAAPAEVPAQRPQLAQPMPQQAVPVPAAPPTSKPPTSETARAVATPPARTPSQPAKTLSEKRHMEDPIAAAIRSAEHNPYTTPPADIPNATGSNPARVVVPVSQKPAQRLAAPVRSEAQAASMVLQIQRGLSNIAYADVEVDGVAGSQTKAAIRRFQKHYRLPETGEPDEQVLKKLKSIGAL
jgi:hypothetical protein